MTYGAVGPNGNRVATDCTKVGIATLNCGNGFYRAVVKRNGVILGSSAGLCPVNIYGSGCSYAVQSYGIACQVQPIF